jgi:DNA-binding CsgD family transcriptional regulator/tetratricopeptide (TPR) repeat protein
VLPGEADLLERSRERAALAAAVDSALAGDAALLVIEGPPGIGKTRLLAETRNVAGGAGFRVLTARGSPLEHSFPFGVVRQLFEAPLLAAGHEQLSRWLSGAAEPAGEALGRARAPGGDTGVMGDFAVLHGLYWLVVNLSREAPLLLSVDDLQWADQPSLRMLAHLGSRMEGLPTMLAVGIRQHDGTGTGGCGDASAVDRLLTTPGRVHLMPGPLSAEAVSHLVAARLGTDGTGGGIDSGVVDGIDVEFARACHVATAGNPLLLHELLSVAAAEGWSPTAANGARVLDLGSRAVARHVALRLDRLGPRAGALARAVALLGDDCRLDHAAVLAGLPVASALRLAGELQRAAILRVRPSAAARLAYQHPLIRAAVYQSMPTVDQLTGHSMAADVLVADHQVAVERVAAHLLVIPATGDPRHAAVLGEAAAAALARGAPDVASTYLRRALAEPLDDAERLDLLRRAGSTTMLVDADAAAGYLAQALPLTTDPGLRAEIAIMLGAAHVSAQRFDKALTVWTAALAELSDAEDGPAVTLMAGRIAMSLVTPSATAGSTVSDTALRAARRGDLPGRQLAGVLACRRGYDGDPAAIDLARHAVDTGLLLRTTGQELVCAWNVLVHADDPLAPASIEAAIAGARRRGGVHRMVGAMAHRALSRLRRGELAGAEADCRECMRLAELSNVHMVRTHVGPWLAETLIEQGRLDEAQAAIDWIGLLNPTMAEGQMFPVLCTTARLQATRGDHEAAARTAMLAGARFAAVGGHNPAIVPWRSEAALALHAIGNRADARVLADEELDLAVRWGCASTVGRALWVAGVVTGDLDRLRRAVTVLEPSPARLERAKALLALGRGQHQAGQRQAGLESLRAATELAERCGAHAVLTAANAEIRASGAKPRSTGSADGVPGLTDSERRVAVLAAEGHRNRDIAERLFVTTKTVEVHLSNVYRKLSVTRRQLTPDLLV